MPFIRAHEIEEGIRRRYLGRHKAAFRAALNNPGLTEAQRTHLRDQLANLGKAKVYRADSPPAPGAIRFITAGLADPLAKREQWGDPNEPVRVGHRFAPTPTPETVTTAAPVAATKRSRKASGTKRGRKS